MATSRGFHTEYFYISLIKYNIIFAWLHVLLKPLNLNEVFSGDQEKESIICVRMG